MDERLKVLLVIELIALVLLGLFSLFFEVELRHVFYLVFVAAVGWAVSVFVISPLVNWWIERG